MLLWGHDAELPHDNANHVLELSHGKVRAWTAPGSVPERCPVKVHALVCVEPALGPPLVWLGED